MPGDQSTSGSHPGNGGAAGSATGKSGTSGSGAATMTRSAGGGGGGGGWPSGNGGQSGKKAFSGSTGGGGAGGTSFMTDAAQNFRLLTHTNSNGFVEITYTNPVRMQVGAAAPFVAGVSQDLTVTVFGENGVLPRAGKVKLTAGTTFLGYDEVVAGRVDFLFALPEGTHQLNAEFVSFDRSQHVAATLEVTVLPGADHTVTAFRSASQRALPGGTFSLSGYVSSDQGFDLAGETVTVMVDGTPNVVPLRTGGGFSGEFTAPNELGPFEVQAVFAGGSAFAPSQSTVLTIEVFQYQAAVQLQAAPTKLNFGEPFAAAVNVTGRYNKPTGLVHLSDGTRVLATAELDANHSAQFENVMLPLGAHTLTAIYDGSTTYGEAVSEAHVVTVVPAATTTTLMVTNDAGGAGEPVQLEVLVATTVTGVRDLQGNVTITLNGEAVAELAAGDDIDATPRDGVSKYQTVLYDLPAGQHHFVAVFEPAEGFTASSSEPQPLALVARGTVMAVTPDSLTVVANEPALVTAQVSLASADGANRQEQQDAGAPQLDGTVVATVNDELVGEPVAFNAATGMAELRVLGLPVGSHSVAVTFHPDSPVFAPSSQTVRVTVLGAQVSAPGGVAEGAAGGAANGAADVDVSPNGSAQSLAATGAPTAETTVMGGVAGTMMRVGALARWRVGAVASGRDSLSVRVRVRLQGFEPENT